MHINMHRVCPRHAGSQVANDPHFVAIIKSRWRSGRPAVPGPRGVMNPQEGRGARAASRQGVRRLAEE